MKHLFFGTLLSVFIAAPAFAGPELFIEDFVGTIKVETSSSAEISVIQEDNMKGVNLYKDGDDLKVDGGIKEPDGNDCKGYHGSYLISWFKKESQGDMGGYKNLDDYPKLTINAPKDTILVIRNSIPFMTVGDINAADVNLSSCGKVNLGNLSGDLTSKISGSGDLNVGDIAGNANVQIRGSGDVVFGNVQDLRLKVAGSGDAELGKARSADISVGGSGDVEIEDINGPVSVVASGSSDVDIGDVMGDFIYAGQGSGDLSVDSVIGRISVKVSGSGDVNIDSGKSSVLNVSTSGASEFNFDGVADKADLYASGASDIYVSKVTGEVRSRESGSADIDIN